MMIRIQFRAVVFLFASLAIHFSCTQKKAGSKLDVAVGDLRNVHFPDTPAVTIEDFHHNFVCQNPEYEFDLSYLDTVETRMDNADDFARALRGYLSSSFSGLTLVSYDLHVTDTLIGKVNGLFVSGYTIDTARFYKQVFCFITVANKKCYAFFAFQLNPSPINTASKQFFGSIQFNTDDFSESHFRTAPIKLHKPIGKIWHFTTDFELKDAPTFESDDNNSNAPPK